MRTPSVWLVKVYCTTVRLEPVCATSARKALRVVEENLEFIAENIAADEVLDTVVGSNPKQVRSLSDVNRQIRGATPWGLPETIDRNTTVGELIAANAPRR